MGLHVLLSDRRAEEALPALGALLLDLKTEELSVAALPEVLGLRPQVLLVDAADNPGQGHAVLRAVRDLDAAVPTVVVVERRDLERFPWETLADDLLYPGAPEPEIRIRLAMLRRRTHDPSDTVVRLGPLTMDVDSYAVTVAGRTLDLTYKEFELLRFLAERPGRVFTRPTLLREVWGYDFYGGTRTVDVHVRRLRAKLGPEHESLVETVRGVGYRAAEG
ncbi:MAG TPA: response regulator transcription factor [Actinomycetota bacterium]|nr:response regulator transcription factor [Actinomycetota bacterium]